MDTLKEYLSWVDRRSDAAKQQSLSVAARAEVERLILGADEPSAAMMGFLPDTRQVVLRQNPVGALNQLTNDVVPELKMVTSILRWERLATTTAWAQWLPAPYVDYRMLQ